MDLFDTLFTPHRNETETVGTLYVDMSCMIKNSVKIRPDQSISEYTEINFSIMNEDVITNTLKRLLCLVEEFDPRVLHIVYDGIVCTSTLMQRREEYIKKPTVDKNEFDTLSITLGTQFMKKLSNRIESCIYFGIFKCKIITDGSRNPGECELKILNHVKQKSSEKIMIYGLGSKYVTLSLTSINYKNISVCREYIGNNIKVYLDVSKCLESLNICDTRRMDLILCMLLGGTNFSPSLEFLKTNSTRWVIDVFVPFKKRIIDSDNQIVWDVLLEFFKESQYIEKYQTQNRISYYENVFGDCTKQYVQTICDDYCISIASYWNYYIINGDSIMSPPYYYYHHITAPLISDIISYPITVKGTIQQCDKELLNQLEDQDKRNIILEQLLCVIPLSRKLLLPTPLQDIVNSESNPVAHWYVDYDPSNYRVLPAIDISQASLILEICEHLIVEDTH